MAHMYDRMGFYAPGALGKSRRLTPEGFLLCENVAIARTGTQVYSPQELALEPNKAGEIRIERLPEEVFRDETVASFEGKPVTVNHPNEFVSPDNWQQLAVGVTQNVRRGTGIEDDLLFADLLITSADAIAYVNRDLPELSCGYDSDYEQTEPGRGVQRNIIGNHVALVERGRAGPRCAINDEEPQMKRTFMDRLSRLITAMKSKDEKAVKAELEDEDPDEGTGELQEMRDALKSVRDELKELKDKRARDEAEEEEEKEKKAKDALLEAEALKAHPDLGKLYTGDALKAIVTRAEILAPGIAIPTADAANKDAVPQLMVKALATADGTEAGKACIAPFLMGRELKALTGDALLGVFNGAAELARVRNNDAGRRTTASTRDFGKPASVTDINAANRAFWKL